MTLTIHDQLVQGTGEWLEVRRGIITASTVGQLITTRKLGAIDFDCPACDAKALNPCQSKTKPGAVIKTLHPERAAAAKSQSRLVIEPASNDTSRGLTMTLVAERITGHTEPTWISDDMQRGIDDEPIARAKYAEHYAPVEEVGFMVEDKWGFRLGFSPDGLVGDDGLIEIKSRRQKTQLSTVIAGHPPLENMAQLQAGLLVSGRKWIDYVSYCGGMHLFVHRVYPSQKWFDAILQAVRNFEDNAQQTILLYQDAINGLHPTERTNYDLDMVI